MGKFIDLTGQKFGKLTVLNKVPDSKPVKWKCRCDCGKIIYTPTTTKLKTGHSSSCGCSRKKKNIKNLTGQRFGSLTVLKDTGKRRNRHVIWECKCDCGQVCEVCQAELIRNETQSCGHHRISLGEEKIKSILDFMGITYEREKVFNDCINPETQAKLRFDFYLPEYNYCIEYDGIQHFKANGGWNTKEKQLELKKRDTIKENYCTKYNIKLYRIKYTDFDSIEKILKELLL